MECPEEANPERQMVGLQLSGAGVGVEGRSGAVTPNGYEASCGTDENILKMAEW